MNTNLIKGWLSADESREKILLNELGISASLLGQIKRGLKPSYPVIKLMAIVMNVSVDDLSPEFPVTLARASS